MRWFKFLYVLLAVVGFAAFAPSSQAHHSAKFDFVMEKMVTLNGVVKQVWWANPHVRIYLTVTDDAGKQIVWVTHSSSPNILRRNGWLRDTIQVGDHITISGNPPRDGGKKLYIRGVVLPDGTKLNRFGYTN